jgi:hypothetical protein
MGGRKRSWEQESLSFGDILNFSRKMLSLAKDARDLGEAAGVPRGSLRNLASLLLDIEDGVKAQTGVGITDKIQEYLTTLIPQNMGEESSAEETSYVDRRIEEVFRVWEKLVAAGYSLPRDQFDQGSEYSDLIEDFYERLRQLQPSKESADSLAGMVEPMVERARELVRSRGSADLPDTGFSGQVRGDPNYVKILLEAVANRRSRAYW